MAIFEVKLELPEVLYHGTAMRTLQGIMKKPINEHFWKSNRDFGAGFYTTIDMFQAARWARKDFVAATQKLSSIKINKAYIEHELPAIAVFSCNPDNYSDHIRVLDFRGESKAWAQFILSHRLQSTTHLCQCTLHPQMVFGCMADNDTGEIVN